MADISNESQSVPVSIAHTEDTEEGRAEGTSGYGLWRDNMVHAVLFIRDSLKIDLGMSHNFPGIYPRYVPKVSINFCH